MTILVLPGSTTISIENTQIMQIVFFYIEKSNNGFIQNQWLNFSSDFRFKVRQNDRVYELYSCPVPETDKLSQNIFAPVENVSAIVGKNGIGRCTFDEENTNMFFDKVVRRYEKEGPKTMIFTSNKQPGAWGEYFTGQDDLLAALDRIFDNANVFDIKGNSYRGRACTTYAVEAGDNVTK